MASWSDSESGLPRVRQLTGNDPAYYFQWKPVMEARLHRKRTSITTASHPLTTFLHSEKPKREDKAIWTPAEGESAAKRKVKEGLFQAAVSAWEEADLSIYYMLVEFTSDAARDVVLLHEHHGVAAWSALISTYETAGELRKEELRTAIRDTTMGDNVHGYITMLETKLRELNQLGDGASKQDLLAAAIKQVRKHDVLKDLHPVLWSGYANGTLTYDKMKDTILPYSKGYPKSDHDHGGKDGSGRSLNTKTHGANYCDYHKMEGHTTDECNARKRSEERAKGRVGGDADRDGSGGGYGRGRRGRGSDGTKLCHICRGRQGEPGHLMATCPLLQKFQHMATEPKVHAAPPKASKVEAKFTKADIQEAVAEALREAGLEAKPKPSSRKASKAAAAIALARLLQDSDSGSEEDSYEADYSTVSKAAVRTRPRALMVSGEALPCPTCGQIGPCLASCPCWPASSPMRDMSSQPMTAPIVSPEVVARGGAGPSLSMGWVLRVVLIVLVALIALPFGRAARPAPVKRTVGAKSMTSSVVKPVAMMGRSRPFLRTWTSLKRSLPPSLRTTLAPSLWPRIQCSTSVRNILISSIIL